MIKHKTMGLLTGVLMAGICTVSFGDALLLDMYGTADPTSTVDWSIAGITEDVMGACGGGFSSSGAKYHITGGITCSMIGVTGKSGASHFSSAMLNDYHYVKNGVASVSFGGFANDAGGANTFLTHDTFAGLGGNAFTLQTNQTYRLYLFGAGGADNQNTKFTFDGVTKTTASAIAGTAESAGHSVTFDFTTGADLTGFSIDFTYENDASEYGAFNGLALVAIDILPMSYANWAAGYPGIGSETNDFDLDLRDNLFEYAVGGDPTVIDTVGNPTFLQTAGGLKYIYTTRNDDTNLVVEVETTDDLVGGSWSTGYSVVEGTNAVSSLFNEITNSIPITAGKTFIRLKVEN